MSTALALLFFAVGLGVSLGASELLVRGLSRLGVKVGLAAGLVGLLTALGADGPEISSAITALLSGAKDVGLGVILGSNLFNLAALLGFSAVVAGRVSFRRIVLVLDGSVALWATLVVGSMLLIGLAPVIALVLVLAVFLFYVFVLLTKPRVIHRDLERSDAVPGLWGPVWWILPSVAAIVAGSIAMVNGALTLGDQWHLSRIFLGAVALAAITSLPNAYAATRLATSGNGTAVVSLAFNSNTLNLLAGVSLPAVLIGGLALAPGAVGDIAWLTVLTLAAIGLGYLQRGLNRWGGLLLIGGYLIFIVSILR